jgi:hypothetical protein
LAELDGEVRIQLLGHDRDKGPSIVKNRFGFSILLFTAFNVDDKSYRQVLTPVNNAQRLLKLEILEKFRLVTNHKMQHKAYCSIF